MVIPEKSKPNILLLVIDSARADRFSCYGYSRNTTPAFDQLSKSSTLFMRNYASGNETLSSHVSVFTGVPPYFHKAASGYGIYDGRYPFISEVLQKHGYHTVGISNNPVLGEYRGFERGFDVYHKLWWIGTKSNDLRKRFGGWLRRLAGKLYTFMTMKMHMHQIMEKKSLFQDKGGKRIIELLKGEIAEAKGGDKPLFLFANLLDSHGPFLAPKPFRGKFHKGGIPRSIFDATLYKGVEFMIHEVPFTEEDHRILNACYDECLAYVDSLMGELFEFMRVEGVLDDFLIIITSDHGELLIDKPGLIGHGITTYEALIRVPLLIRYPSRFPPGKKIDILTQHIDIFPTILGTVGLDVGLYVDRHKGIDLGGDLSMQRDRCIVVDQPYLPNPERLKYPSILEKWNHIERALLYREYKYTWTTSGNHRLYNILEDPNERNNIYRYASQEIVDKLHSMLVKWYEDQLGGGESFDLARYEYREACWEGIIKDREEKEEEKEIKKRLRDLGYLA